MFSSNKGLDYLSILSELDRLGYDIEWQNINSRWFVPQNRERIYTIGHLRRCGSRKVLPITGTDGENSISIIGHRDGYRRNMQTFSPDGITEALSTCQGGGREHHVGIKSIGTTQPHMHSTGDIHDIEGIAPTCLGRDYKQPKQVAIPVLTPDRIKKRQNGRRFKEDGEPMFTLTAQDRHGVGVEVGRIIGGMQKHQSVKDDGICTCLTSSMGQGGGYVPMIELKLKEATQILNTSHDQGIYVEMPEGFVVYALWYEPYQCYIAIRKLTPKECFRLQGWTDDYFEKAAFVNSDSQLYKQAGNGVTVDVIYHIAQNINKSTEGENK